jgi:hypothetical protein
MVMVEMAFSGSGGLEQLVEECSEAVEMVLYRHAMAWGPAYPVTLREALALGLQQQIMGGHACVSGHAGTRRPAAYRVWLNMPEGGLRGWTALLACRILAGCGEEDAPIGSQVRRDLQHCLVHELGPYLARVEVPSALAGTV